MSDATAATAITMAVQSATSIPSASSILSDEGTTCTVSEVVAVTVTVGMGCAGEGASVGVGIADLGAEAAVAGLSGCVIMHS